MRICIATPEYPPATSGTGGIGTQFAALAPALAELGHEVHVVVPADPAGRASAPAVAIHTVPRPGLGRLFPLADPIFAGRLARRVGALGAFDVVVAPEFGGHAHRYARRKEAGPLVTMLQTSLDQTLAMSAEPVVWRGLLIQHAIQRRAERSQALRSDAILACSRSLLDWSRRIWPLERISCEVLPNVIDVARLRNLAATGTAPTVPGEGPLITFSGRLESRKGVDVLVRAMAEVWDDAPEVRLAIAGRDAPWGQERASERLRRLAGPRAGRLHLLGPLAPGALMPLLSRSAIVATPSRWEAFGLAAFEALALGVPTVATAAGGFADFLESGTEAILVPPDDPVALGEAILGLLRDPAGRRALGDAGATRAEQFDISNQVGRYVAFFEQVAGA